MNNNITRYEATTTAKALAPSIIQMLVTELMNATPATIDLASAFSHAQAKVKAAQNEAFKYRHELLQALLSDFGKI